MTRLDGVLEHLAEADVVAGELRALRESRPEDLATAVNLESVLRRRGDLEHELRALLSWQQLELVTYRVEQFDGSDAPAAAVASSILTFQALITSAFDALRAGPKRTYQPSSENQRLSALQFGRAPGAREAIQLTIPNERLLGVETVLDMALDLVFELFAARGKVLIRNLAARVGIATVTAARAWAENAVQHGLTTAITWHRPSDKPRTVAFSHSEALLFRTAIDAVADDTVQPRREECELVSIDESARTFRLVLANGTMVAGDLTDSFPPGGHWTTRRWYVADLLRADRIRYGSGAEDVRWSLRGLSPIE